MNVADIRTSRLTLVLRDPAEVLAWVASLPAETRAQVSPDWIARLRASPAPDPWTCGFAIARRDTEDVIGSCGFKGPPENGVVEIAYGVDAEHQGRGHATEAARALIDYAFSAGSVRAVRAHTLPGPNASTRVLTKCGFTLLAQVLDPEDGLVWRWEINRSTDDPRRDDAHMTSLLAGTRATLLAIVERVLAERLAR